MIGIHAQQHYTANNIKHSHERHQGCTHLSYTLYTTYYNECHKYRYHNTCNPCINAHHLVGKIRNSICLNSTTYAECSNSRKQGEEHTCPLSMQTIFKGIHRTAYHISFLGCLAIFHGKQSFAIFRSNTEDTSEPAPQHGTWTAQRYGCSHTYDVTSTNGSRESCCQSTKLAHITLAIFILSKRKFYGCKDFTLWELQSDGKQNMRTNQQYYHRIAPQEITYS